MLDPVLIFPFARWSEQQVSLAAGSPSQIVGGDQCRVLLLITQISVGVSATVSPSSDVSGTAGIQLNTNNQRLEISIDKYPGIVGSEWWGVGNAGPVSINVITVSVRRDRIVTPKRSWTSSLLQQLVRR